MNVRLSLAISVGLVASIQGCIINTGTLASGNASNNNAQVNAQAQVNAKNEINTEVNTSTTVSVGANANAGTPSAPPAPAKPLPVANPAPVAAEVESGPVRDIAVLGLHAVAPETVLGAIAVEIGDTVTAAEVEAAIQRVYALGTFQRVGAGGAPIADGVQLTFTVVENPTLVDVTLLGVTKLAITTLAEPFLAGRGAILDYNKLNLAVETLKKTYADAGFVLARVSAFDMSESGGLTIKVAEGVIHDITLRGNVATRDDVIRRVITLQPGEVLERERLKQDLKRIYDLGFFRDITLKFENVPGTDQVSVVIGLEEK